MRINVYAEELTSEVKLVTKEVTDEKFGTRTFYGVRVFLKSPPELHADPEDDDRSAITFWVPWTRADGHRPQAVWDLLTAIAGAAMGVPYGHDAPSAVEETAEVTFHRRRVDESRPYRRDPDAGYQ